MAATKIMPESSSTHDSAAVGGGMNPRERILLLPQDYIGPVEKCTRKIWVVEGGSMTHRAVTYVPGLYKIFDEVLVYAADNKQRDPRMDFLHLEIKPIECRISIYYNGQGVPIELHPEDGAYMPEVVFGDLSNYEEVAGGSSSYGVRLANLFSTEFVIEIVDGRLGKKYKQIFSENMGKKSEPDITDSLRGVNWTRITFKPDLGKFHMTHLDDDIIALMRKRVIDMVGFLGITVKVTCNGQMFKQLKGFPNSIFPYIRTASKGRVLQRICHRINDQLEVCVTQSEGTFQQVSFVNKFATIEGGTHVDYVSDQIAACMVKICGEDFQVEVSEVKKHLWVFVNAVIDNPIFDSPTRDALMSPQESFGSSCELVDGFLYNVYECIIGELSTCNGSSEVKKAPGKKRAPQCKKKASKKKTAQRR
ncbi:unnamed protein product [Urochloa humidicola]